MIIKTSPRKGGNSDALADRFAEGAREAGNTVETVSLADKDIRFCRGCLACMKTQRCVIRDDAGDVCSMMRQADAVVWVTPVYYYSVSGQMKTMIDRTNPLFSADYNFRDIYLLAAAAEDDAGTVNGSVTALQGWTDCYPKARVAGVVFAGGVTGRGDISGHKALEEAYILGRSVKA